MAVKIYKPTSPGRRGMTSATFEEVTDEPQEGVAPLLTTQSYPLPEVAASAELTRLIVSVAEVTLAMCPSTESGVPFLRHW